MEATKEKHATHTPGPWQIEDCTPGESTGLRFEVGTKDSVIARTTDGWKEANANARLIAAAPEAYDLLCKISNSDLGDIETAIQITLDAREVLAKVDGGEG
jgi:hypothetical protein